MTKAEILKEIGNSTKAQAEALSVVNKLFESVAISSEAIVLSSVIHTMNGCICDTLRNISLILCEMLPEEAPEKAPEMAPQSKYDPACLKGFPECQCVTCARYRRSDERGPGCCMTHRKSCRINQCPDYVKEDLNASV